MGSFERGYKAKEAKSGDERGGEVAPNRERSIMATVYKELLFPSEKSEGSQYCGSQEGYETYLREIMT
jgi:hypothetical protein